jgi:hypothetical protein
MVAIAKQELTGIPWESGLDAQLTITLFLSSFNEANDISGDLT